MKKLFNVFTILAAALLLAPAAIHAQTYEPGQTAAAGNFGGPGDAISLRGGFLPFVSPSANNVNGATLVWNTVNSQFQYEGGENVVTFSATPTFSATSTINYIQLTGNVTGSTLAAGLPGQETTFVICQNATGSYTFTWPTTVYNGGTIGSTASKCSIQTLAYSAQVGKWVATAAITTNQ